MSAPRYVWRQLNDKQRAELLAWRKARGHPWHSSPHRPNFGHLRFLISASCFEHRHYEEPTAETTRTFGLTVDSELWLHVAGSSADEWDNIIS